MQQSYFALMLISFVKIEFIISPPSSQNQTNLQLPSYISNICPRASWNNIVYKSHNMQILRHVFIRLRLFLALEEARKKTNKAPFFDQSACCYFYNH